jgi:hypothetical protein
MVLEFFLVFYTITTLSTNIVSITVGMMYLIQL